MRRPWPWAAAPHEIIIIIIIIIIIMYSVQGFLLINYLIN